jgi:putative membrane protein
MSDKCRMTRSPHASPGIPDDAPAESAGFDAMAIRRPDQALLTYFIITSALTLVLFPFVFIPLYFKYHTLEYEFDDEGVSMRWGLLFRQEINLTYRRIQDIHVTRGIIQRWLGLASLAVQTASGTSGAEMTIIGIRQPELLRDFLYAKMRGADVNEDSDQAEGGDLDSSPIEGATTDQLQDEALSLLREIRDEMQLIAKRSESAETTNAGEDSA